MTRLNARLAARPDTRLADRSYAAAINRAAVMLLAMSFRPEIKKALAKEVAAAVEVRGDRAGDQRSVKFDLRVVCEEIVDRAMAILSEALRQRLPGIADEMDAAFGDRLHDLLGSVAQALPTH